MKNYIANKTVLITGATSGIGKSLAMHLCDYQVNLILVARNLSILKQMQLDLQEKTRQSIHIAQLDVRDRTAVEKVIANILKNHSVDILINNAGLALGIEKIDAGDLDNWDTMIDTNLKGLLYVSRPIIAQMRQLETAHIVNLGSVAGKTAYPGGNVYCATKAAVHAITDAMNADLFQTAIKVTTVAPGAVETNFSTTRFNGDTEKADAVYAGYTALIADDIAESIITVINTPKHVNIQLLEIMPTAQRNPYLLDRG